MLNQLAMLSFEVKNSTRKGFVRKLKRRMFVCITRYTKTSDTQDPGGSDRTPWTTALFVPEVTALQRETELDRCWLLYLRPTGGPAVASVAVGRRRRIGPSSLSDLSLDFCRSAHRHMDFHESDIGEDRPRSPSPLQLLQAGTTRVDLFSSRTRRRSTRRLDAVPALVLPGGTAAVSGYSSFDHSVRDTAEPRGRDCPLSRTTTRV